MRIDDSLKIAAQLLASHMQQTRVDEKRIGGMLHNIHRDVLRIQTGSYTAWQDELPPLDILDQAALDEIAVPKTYAPPTHPLSGPEVTVEDKVAGTVHHDRIECLECGKSAKLIKTHLLASHNGMTWSEYVDRHGLPDNYPTAPLAHVERQRADMMRIRGKSRPADGETSVEDSGLGQPE